MPVVVSGVGAENAESVAFAPEQQVAAKAASKESVYLLPARSERSGPAGSATESWGALR